MFRLWMISSSQHVFHQHSASISNVAMTTVHSVMTTEEAPMACGTPRLPVGFLLRLSLLPWIQNHPFFSLSFNAGSCSPIPHLSDRHHTHITTERHIFRDTYMHQDLTLTLIKVCTHVCLHTHTLECLTYWRSNYSKQPPKDFH